jgi:hypothetical protein
MKKNKKIFLATFLGISILATAGSALACSGQGQGKGAGAAGAIGPAGPRRRLHGPEKAVWRFILPERDAGQMMRAVAECPAFFRQATTFPSDEDEISGAQG